MVEIFTPQVIQGLAALFVLVVLSGGVWVALGLLPHRATGLAPSAAGGMAPHAARSSEKILSSIVDNTTNGIIVLDRNSVVQAFNPAAEQIFGYGPSEIVGRNISMILPAQYREIHDRGVSGSSLGQARVMSDDTELQGLRKDGKRIWLDSINTVVDWDGEPAILSTQVDVTERKRLEDELRHSQKMEAIGQLAGGVAHDFNNLLQVVSGFTLLAMDDIGDEAEVMQDLTMIEGAAARAASRGRRRRRAAGDRRDRQRRGDTAGHL